MIFIFNKAAARNMFPGIQIFDRRFIESKGSDSSGNRPNVLAIVK